MIGRPPRGAPDSRCAGTAAPYNVTMSDEITTARADSSAAVAAARDDLKDYWSTGAGSRLIRWGTDKDLTRCISLVGRAAGVASRNFNVAGFCNNIHKEKYGRPNDPDD